MNARLTPRRGFQVPFGVTVGERLRAERQESETLLAQLRASLAVVKSERESREIEEAKQMELWLLGGVLNGMMNGWLRGRGGGGVLAGRVEGHDAAQDAKCVESAPASTRPRRMVLIGRIPRRRSAATHRNGGVA